MNFAILEKKQNGTTLAFCIEFLYTCASKSISRNVLVTKGGRNQTTYSLVESIDFHGFRFPFNYVNYILQGSSILLNNHTYREYFCSWRYSNNCVTCAHCTLLWLLVSYWITYFPFFPWGYLMKTQNTSMITKA